MSIVLVFTPQTAFGDEPADYLTRQVAPQAPDVGETVEIAGDPWSVVERRWAYPLDGVYCFLTVVPLFRIEPKLQNFCNPPDPDNCTEPRAMRVDKRASGDYQVEFCMTCGYEFPVQGGES